MNFSLPCAQSRAPATKNTRPERTANQCNGYGADDNVSYRWDQIKVAQMTDWDAAFPGSEWAKVPISGHGAECQHQRHRAQIRNPHRCQCRLQYANQPTPWSKKVRGQAR